MKKKMISALLLIFFANEQVFSFCGFYVSKADGTLKNKTSQVIMVRDGDRTVITMSNDFKGDAEDFAMVVPVPTVLKKSDIKVLNAELFQRLNDYSKPRLVEYYDQNPCMSQNLDEVVVSGLAKSRAPKALGYAESKDEEKYKVKVEAQYTVGEYDIVILSAEESGGLKKWLDKNGYKIPKGADEVLEPYIKSNLKFFVVKVNLEEQENLGVQQLRPLQIQFTSPKFMLPIRLGMANADGDQDMIVYAFTRTGRVELTNYRTVNMPTGKNIPLFVQPKFGNFYSNVFNHQWNNEGKNVGFLEYAWDVSPSNFMKCDPCVSEAPNFSDLQQAGVWWLGKDTYNDYVNQYEPKSDKVYFTRLHIRYNRSSFPQDLMFQSTPNIENYQARYIITHPATGDFSCEAGKKYLKDLKERRKQEMEMLTQLTGKGYGDWDDEIAVNDADDKQNNLIPADTSYKTIAVELSNPVHGADDGTNAIIALSFISLAGIGLYWRYGRS
ncbi:MAG: DUF2330 domain-containing protein [Sphingobacteriales bacterium]|nr:DUF2330 domain-containing protein [Sphingobacteriales bacterium]MBI3718645.1 DUF2330 domain-containing protein [Sphingobacteriales bacterium]